MYFGFLFAQKGCYSNMSVQCSMDLYGESRLFIDDQGRKKYEPTRNYDRLNVHNIDLLTMWRANVDFQPVLSHYDVLKYITKYALKEKKRSESYHHMLTRISNSIGSEDHALCAYRKFLAEMIVDCDIGAQETCHMFLKQPLVVCSRKFVSLNVGRKVFRKISRDGLQCSPENSFVQHYQKRPFFLEHLSLIETKKILEI